MTLNTVTVTFNITDFQQVPVGERCTVSFRPTSTLVDTNGNVTISPQVRALTFLGGSGFLPGIVANDNASLSPANSAYWIDVTDADSGAVIVPPFRAEIKFASGASQNLATLYANQVVNAPPTTTASITVVREWGYNVHERQSCDLTGTVSASAAIAAAVSDVLGPALPASNTRVPSAPLFFPPGTYKLTSDLNLLSTYGLKFDGAGPALTKFLCSGAGFSRAGINVDGALGADIGGFSMVGDGTEVLPAAIRLDWTTAAQRSTSHCKFRDITMLQDLKFVNGFDLTGNGTVQLDGTEFDNTLVSGGQNSSNWSPTGNWLKAYALGNGTYANNYNHVGTNMQAAGCYHGWDINASSLALNGAQPASNFIDFYVLPGAQTTIANVQSQGCSKFLVVPASFPSIPLGLRDIEVGTTNLDAGNDCLVEVLGGMCEIDNFIATTIIRAAAFIAAKMKFEGTVANTRMVTAALTNITLFGVRTTNLLPTATKANLTVRGYNNYNPNTAAQTLAAGDLLSTYSASAWNTIA